MSTRRRDIREDPINLVIEAEKNAGCNAEETIGIILIPTLAGTETTANLISSSLLQLGEHPDQRAMLVEDISLISGSCCVTSPRCESSIQSFARVANRDIEMHGREIPEQARILLLHGSANRDERGFDEPDRLDLKRKPKRHLAFGDGTHHCIGSQLAQTSCEVLTAAA